MATSQPCFVKEKKMAEKEEIKVEKPKKASRKEFIARKLMAINALENQAKARELGERLMSIK